MPFLCHLSTSADAEQALSECLAGAKDFGPVDLAFLFFSPHHRAAADRLGARLWQQCKPRCLLGCPGETIIGNDREVEEGPALSLWLGRWQSPVQVTSFHLTMEQTSEGLSLLGYPDELAEADPANSLILTLADPYTFPIDAYLSHLNQEKPKLPLVGGMASGATAAGENVLVINDQAKDQGAVSVLLQGPVLGRSIVSQGCRPIGQPMVVTKAKENVILELGGKTPLACLQELWQALTPHDQELVRRGLHVGRVISEYQDKFQRGDFLIRNVMALDRDSGAMYITERIRPGTTIQFHVRDAQSADEDLNHLLQSASGQSRAGGGLLFSCNGRGTRLFDQPDHDARLVRTHAGAPPLAGFFAQGELGPVGGQNFIHGFTASLVLFGE